ncbi:hypothetical protein F2Q69_00013130 [Brassica cretica]|uniref:Uncharacterized protein n=1 Tax=Brassica cretica TaxID=69181 RepID=A0A8S9R2Y5_BRACR|nr:hypothetical protein F2Q69_00013130 [Brassica cretica]
MSKSISVDDQQQEWTNHVLTEELSNIREPPSFRRVYPKTFGFQAKQFHKLWVSGGRSPQTSMFQKGLPQNLQVPSEPVPQTMSFSILESGCRFFRRSFSSQYPIMGHISKKKTDLAYHCNPTFRRVYPKTFGFQAKQFHKLWVSGGRSPQTSMFQKGLPQNLQVPSEPVPQTMGFSILESGCDYAPRGPTPERQISLITAMRIQDQEFLLPSGATYHLEQISTDTSDLYQPNLRFLPSIDMQGQDPESPLVNRPKQATSLGISIRPLFTPSPKRRLQSDVLFTPSPKGPATDKPVLMPTEASSVSPSGLAPTRENYFMPRAPLNPETSTRPRSVPGKFVLLQVRTRYRPKKNLGKKHYWSDILSRGSLLRMSNFG